MKKVRFLVGVGGLAPAALGMMVPAAANAAPAANGQTENSARSAKTLSLQPLTANAPDLPSCPGSIEGFRTSEVGIHVCGKESGSHYIYWTQESVYYRGHRDITWRLHVSGKVTQKHTLSAGTGWHSYRYNMNRTVPQSGSSVICVGASNTPGFPCEAVPVA